MAKVRDQFRENNPSWKGGVRIHKGYRYILQPDHPRSTKGYVFEHIVIAEEALGKRLPVGSEIHHHGPKKDQCIVVCQDHAYHGLLHQRTRSLSECGNADYRKCWICKQYDDPSSMIVKVGSSPFHKQCQVTYNREYHRTRKGNNG